MRFRILRAAGLVAVAALQIPWLLQPIPLALKLAHLGFVALAIARPSTACLVLAVVGPVAHSILAGLSVPIAGTRLLEQLVLAVITGAIVRHPPHATRSRTAVTATFVSLVAVASAASVMPGRLLVAEAGVSTWHRLLQLWQGQHFNPDAAWAPFVLAVYTIEAMALLWAVETMVRRERRLAERLILCLLIGHAAAAILNLAQVRDLAAQGGAFVSSFLNVLRTSRISLQYDRNAAGSVFVMVLLASIALLSRPRWRTLSVLALSAVLVIGVWLTGSRTALAALVVVPAAVGVLVGVGLVRGVRGRISVALAAVGGLALAAGLYASYYPSGRNPANQDSLAGRLTMAQVALRMTHRAPVFGVGIGTFYEQSPLFGAPPIYHLSADGIYVATPQPENAHNNFLQILAEEGVVGLVAMIALLVATLGPAIRTPSPDPTIRWLLAAVAGFLLTWLTGHPILEPDAAFVFALVLGALAGLTRAPAAPARAAWLPALLAVLLLITVPIRMHAEDARHIGVGLSAWRTDPGRTAYREAGATFSLYFPTHREVLLPIRTHGAVGLVRVELYVDGRMVQVFGATDTWQKVAVRLTSRVWGYERVDFKLVTDRSGDQASATLDVGVLEVR